MADLEKIARTPESAIAPGLLELCRSVEAKRARTVIDHILQYGLITTEDLSEIYGYDHPPRAIRDVRENGIPLITHRITSARTGRQMGAYTFDDLSKVRRGRIGGRSAFPKQFKKALLERYGARDAFTGAQMHERYLQIDHRVPYEVAGDDSTAEFDPAEFMLLDSSSNRAKSWSCENCDNFSVRQDPEVCRRCFWASPEDYDHIAGAASRRAEIVWTGDETEDYDRLQAEAKAQSVDLAALIKSKLRE